jgi:hypothetical protein
MMGFVSLNPSYQRRSDQAHVQDRHSWISCPLIPAKAGIQTACAIKPGPRRWDERKPKPIHAPLNAKRPRLSTGTLEFQIAASRNPDQCAITASSNSATMLVILIIGFTAGPAVSL